MIKLEINDLEAMLDTLAAKIAQRLSTGGESPVQPVKPGQHEVSSAALSIQKKQEAPADEPTTDGGFLRAPIASEVKDTDTPKEDATKMVRFDDAYLRTMMDHRYMAVLGEGYKDGNLTPLQQQHKRDLTLEFKRLAYECGGFPDHSTRTAKPTSVPMNKRPELCAQLQNIMLKDGKITRMPWDGMTLDELIDDMKQRSSNGN